MIFMKAEYFAYTLMICGSIFVGSWYIGESIMLSVNVTQWNIFYDHMDVVGGLCIAAGLIILAIKALHIFDK